MKANFLTKRILSLHGFTLLETMIVIAIVAILAAIAIPNYLNQREKVRITVAVTDIKYIAEKVLEFYDENGSFPLTLADMGLDGLRDPWGNPYQYWPVTGDKHQKVRKDRNTHPINTDFDLYSKGADGKTNYPLTAHASQDDVIRANNGGYLGIASNY